VDACGRDGCLGLFDRAVGGGGVGGCGAAFILCCGGVGVVVTVDRSLEDLDRVGIGVPWLLFLLLLLLLLLGSGVLLLLLLLLALLLPASRRFSLALSLSSNLFSMSAMMVSIAAWVMGASRISCGMPVWSGVLGVVVVLAVVVEEEEKDGVVCRCGGVVVWGELPFPLPFDVVAAGWAEFQWSLVCLCLRVSGVKLPKSVPGTVDGSCGRGREENLTLLSSGGLEFGAWILSPIPVPLEVWPPPRVMAVSGVVSPSMLGVCSTRMSGEGLAVGEWSLCQAGGKRQGLP